MTPQLPEFLDQFFVPADSAKKYTHVCTWGQHMWRFSVPAAKLRRFWREVKAGEIYTPDAEVHQVCDQARDIEYWAAARVVETDDAHDRISAADAAAAFKRDTGAEISARALGDTLARVLGWKRIKSCGVMVYTNVKLT